MAKVSANEAIKLTAQYVGCSQSDAKIVIEAYGYIIYKLLLEGYDIRMPVLGRFYLAEKGEQGEHQWKDPRSGEMVTIKAKPAYQKPMFKFSPTVIQEIRSKTEGNLL